jgi:hypothetical protein
VRDTYPLSVDHLWPTTTVTHPGNRWDPGIQGVIYETDNHEKHRNKSTVSLTFMRHSIVTERSANCGQMQHLQKWHQFELVIVDQSQVGTEVHEEHMDETKLSEN